MCVCVCGYAARNAVCCQVGVAYKGKCDLDVYVCVCVCGYAARNAVCCQVGVTYESKCD